MVDSMKYRCEMIHGIVQMLLNWSYICLVTNFVFYIQVFSSIEVCISIYTGVWGSHAFPQLYGKCQRVTRKDVARPAPFQLINCVVLCIVCVQMSTVLLLPGVNTIAVKKKKSMYIYIYILQPLFYL